MELRTREAKEKDAVSIAAIYNQGIEERVATFETALRSPEDVIRWFNGIHPVVVAERDENVIAFAVATEYSQRECYKGVAEFSVYVDRNYRGIGVGKTTMQRLVEECRKRGFWKLLSRVFPENQASRRLLREIGFREVGVYEKHGKLGNEWRDVVIVELLIKENTI